MCVELPGDVDRAEELIASSQTFMRETLADWLRRFPGTIGLVFTDIIRSTELLYDLKTIKHNAVLRAHRSRADALARQLDGRVVDQVGDELFIVLPDAAKAWVFAHQLFHDPGHPRLAIRAGVHAGEVTLSGIRLSGRAVTYGHRVMEHGNADRALWVSDVAKTALDGKAPSVGGDIPWIQADECYLEGVHVNGVPVKQRLWRAS